MEEQGGRGDGAAGLGNETRGGDDGAHGGADFRFGHGDDAVNECLNVGEVALAYGLSAEAVGEGARGELGGPSDDGAGAEAFGGVAGQFRLDAVNLGLWAEPLDGGGDAGEQSAARDGDEDEVDAGQGFDDFETAGSLAGDDLLVVVGRDDDIAMLADEFVGFGEAF